ncbi:MAG TPA: NADH-quinone oxidoreductase subunit N, partial [Candidatus Omnitrophica bacterium]|nr:NADH-quinone oxidoreductase subunit N [Candidatus Omnitrophota bacterium]
MNVAPFIADIKYILPEIILTIAALVILIFSVLIKNKRALAYFSLASLGITLLYVSKTPVITTSLFSGMLVNDSFAAFFKIISIIIALAVILISLEYKEISPNYRGEFYCFILLATTAIMFMGAASNLLMIYLGVEFLSLISYIIAAYWRGNVKSSESGLKYFLIGTACSITMLYGISLLYGLTGSLDLEQINAILYGNTSQPAAISIIILTILIGLGFKIAMVPVHFWCPDVYEGAPTPVTAFFSVGPKIAGFAVLLRFLLTGSIFFYEHWAHLLGILAIITMVVGNLTALSQTNIKRLLAYSSIAHAGYALIG